MKRPVKFPWCSSATVVPKWKFSRSNENRKNLVCFSGHASDSGFSPPRCFVEMPLTALPPDWPETAASQHCREKDGSPSVLICRRLRAEFQNPNEGECVVVCLRLFYARRHPVRSARWSDTGPKFGSEIKNRASISPLPFRHCHGFSFRWIVECTSRTARCLPHL